MDSILKRLAKMTLTHGVHVWTYALILTNCYKVPNSKYSLTGEGAAFMNEVGDNQSYGMQ